MSYPKNSASPPKLFASVVNATTGAAVTSGVAAKYSTGAGSQAAGGGTCQHEGNGQWSYAPTQAETDVDAFGIQFYHVDAVGGGPTVSVVTSASVVQTGDAYARLGAPAGASVSADIAALPTAVEIVAAMDADPPAVNVTLWKGSAAPDLDGLDGLDGSTLALEATAQAILEDTGTTLPAAIEAIEPGGGSYAGDGTGYYTDTVEADGNPLDGVRVQLYTAPNRVGPAYEAYTNALGVFEMWPDPGVYYRWLDLAGYSFSQDVAVTVTEP